MDRPLSLSEDPVYGRRDFSLDRSGVEAALERLMVPLGVPRWLVLGFAEPPKILGARLQMSAPEQPVDNFFRLEPSHGFETLPAVLTLGLRASRFAPILFWEAFHALAPGAVWVDVDYEERCRGTAVSEIDHPQRPYYQNALECVQEQSLSPYRLRLFRKTSPSRISGSIDDGRWTFGVLTAGPSPNAERMVGEILALDLPAVEVVICGPKPANLPDDTRIRQIDLEKPEPRGWITRKKNMIAAAATYENLCIMHDRFFIPSGFVSALKRYGKTFSFVTFPQVYFSDRMGTCIQRYPDYQVLKSPGDLAKQRRAAIFDGHYIFHPRYSDFHETAFCCGGLYVAKKTVWNLVRQNEALYHCEWEDAVFGLESQMMGIPHRVNPYACVESTAPHPMLLTALHVLHPSGRLERGVAHVSAHQRRLARRAPDAIKPLLALTKRSYCAKLVARFNAMPIADRAGRLTESDFDHSNRLSEIWSQVHQRLSTVSPQTRMEVFGIYALISDMIYNHPAPVLQLWTRETERVLTGVAAARRFSFTQLLRDALTFPPTKVISRGWRALRTAGTGEYAPLLDVISYFRAVEAAYPIPFSPDGDNSSPTTRTAADRQTLLNAPENYQTIFFHHADGLLPRMDGWEEDSSSIQS